MELGAIIWVITMGIRAGTPLLFAATGEILNQRAGTMNLGIEGLMLVGAISGFGTTMVTGNKWLGLLAAITVCALLGFIFAFIVINLKANQVAAGIALTIFCTGFSSFIGKPMIGVMGTSKFAPLSVPILSDIPVFGKIFCQDLLVYLAVIFAVGAWFLLYRTRAGLHLRAVGDSPSTADSMGINVYLVRYIYLIVSSISAGLSGAYLSLAYSSNWIEGMTAGRGWITIALVCFSMWNPLRAIAGAYLFGMVSSLDFRLEASGIDVPSYFLRMTPYLLSIAVLVFIGWRMKGKRMVVPATLGIPYERESR